MSDEIVSEPGPDKACDMDAIGGGVVGGRSGWWGVDVKLFGRQLWITS